jgi:hypothetical protein
MNPNAKVYIYQNNNRYPRHFIEDELHGTDIPRGSNRGIRYACKNELDIWSSKILISLCPRSKISEKNDPISEEFYRYLSSGESDISQKQIRRPPGFDLVRK